ncbi:methyltransferase type 11 [Streptococcus sanguinis]|uniref:Methyltransferase type 11 n=1 Tax=Streptococcus sanguinis TaxID=1305 RepID=A0A7H8UYH1_STRSA|nr:methyltransferase type 11 [Streptococcus sanguinis]
MNFRAMDAVFPIREKSVNRIESLSESSPKNAEELRYIDAVRTK